MRKHSQLGYMDQSQHSDAPALEQSPPLTVSLPAPETPSLIELLSNARPSLYGELLPRLHREPSASTEDHASTVLDRSICGNVAEILSEALAFLDEVEEGSTALGHEDTTSAQ